MSIKDLRKYKCDECGKTFTHNIGLNGHIPAVHEKKDSIMITVTKISPKSSIWKYVYKLFMNHTKHWTEF